MTAGKTGGVTVGTTAGPVELAFQLHGPQDGKPVILLHGFPLDSAMWRAQINPLCEAGFRVLLPDLRGAGRSPAGKGPATMDAMADDVAALMRRLRIAKAALGGFSMGGYVALAFAERHAPMLNALMLIDTRAEADSAEGKAKRAQTHAKVQAEGLKPLVQAMLPGMFTTQTWAGRRMLVEEVRSIMMRQPRQGVLDAIQGMAERPDRSAALAAITVPTMVIVGAEDNITPPASAQAMAEAIPGAKLVTVPAAAHLVPLERADDCSKAMLQFLAAI